MKKVALLCLGLALGAANAAEAQLTMQMSNGWSFTFAGNVNAFYIYQTGKSCAGSTVRHDASKDLSVGTGLLPAFAVFDAKGKEGETGPRRALRVRAPDPVRRPAGQLLRAPSATHDASAPRSTCARCS